MMGRREAVARGRGEQWRRRGMVGVGGCPCARRERERQRSREVGWVVVVVAGPPCFAGGCLSRCAAGRHGGAWSVVALLPSCAACASLERVRPAAWRRRGAALPRPHLCLRSCGGRSVCCVVAWRECACRACVRGGGKERGACRAWCGSACGTHPCGTSSPLGVLRREKCARAEEGGAWAARAGRREGAGERCWSLGDEKGGGAPFVVCSRSVRCCVVGVCAFWW